VDDQLKVMVEPKAGEALLTVRVAVVAGVTTLCVVALAAVDAGETFPAASFALTV